MRRRNKMIALLIAVAVGIGSAVTVSSCGSMRGYCGVESEYNFDGHGHKHHKHHKAPKHHKHRHHHGHHD